MRIFFNTSNCISIKIVSNRITMEENTHPSNDDELTDEQLFENKDAKNLMKGKNTLFL